VQPAEEVDLRQRFNSGDRNLLLVALVIIALSAVYVWYNYRAAFPQASLDLRYSREQITERALTFLKTCGLNPAGFRNLTLFDADDDARLFLEREVGLEQANRLMQGEVSVWRWRARWYKPPEKEEMRVWLSPDGRLRGFEHVIAETASGARLDKDAARSRAEEFLRSQTSQPHRLIEEQLEQKPNRHDYVFTWEREGFEVRGAKYRRTVEIYGDRLGAYHEFLHVPEQWERDFTALRSKNILYTQIAQAFYVPLILAAIIVHIQAIRRREVPWRPLILLCAVVGALMVANQWNALPFFLDGMPTSTSVPESVLIGLLQGLGAGVGVFFYVMFAAAPGETLYRSAYPRLLSLPAGLSRLGIQTREFFRASVIGYAFAAFHIAFVVAFYLIGRRFGVWSPQDVEYSDLLSTALPWLYPLTISLLASTSEEFWFRLLAIPLLQKLLRFRWLAILIPAFVWGFLHANYPQQPGYIRGIEVGLIGVAAGYVMVRFGILATLIWHYTVDAVLIGTFLLSSQSWYFRLSGVLVAGAVLFPLALSVYRYRRNGGFLAERGLTNASLATASPPAAAPVETPPVAQPLSPPEPFWPRRYLYVAAAIALAIGFAVRPWRFGDFIEVRIERQTAQDAAGRALSEKGINPAGWQTMAIFQPNLDVATFEYLRRLVGVEESDRIVRERTLHGLWQVRFFQPQQKEEWIVYVDSNGRAFRVDHVLDEKAPGANLSADEARRIAEEYLRTQQKIRLERYRLVDSSAQRRDRRTDHFFVWEDTQFQAGEAEARLSLTIFGDEPSTFRRFLKLPEQWLRDFRRVRLGAYLLPSLGGSVFLTALIVFIRRLANHPFRWRLYLTVSLAALVVAAFSQINQLPTFYANYETAIPIQDYIGDSVLSIVILTLLAGFVVFLAALVVDLFLNLGLGDRRLPRPSLPVTLAFAAILFGVPRALSGLSHWIPGERYSLSLWGLPGASSLAPFFSVVSGTFWSAMVVSVAAVVLVTLAIRVFSLRSLAVWVSVAALAFALARDGGAGLMIFTFASTLAFVAVAFFLMLTAPGALIDLAAAVFLVEALSGAIALLAEPSPFYRVHGGVALGLAVVVVGLVLRYSMRKFDGRTP
jgi:membrane protease YdiL (CAAX protease family)